MNTQTEKQSGFPYIESLRVISALAVIMIHVSGANWFRIDLGSANWIVQTFFNLFGRFGVCVFCMITGALLLRPGKKHTMSYVVSHYVKRVLICFACWVVLYALLYTFLNHEDVKYFFLRLVQLPNHLWYLLMITGMYLAYPALAMIVKNRSVTRYLICLLIALGAFETIYGLTGFFETMAADSYGFSLWSGFLENLVDLKKAAFVPGYLGLFLLGHYIHEYGLGTWHKRVVYAAIPALILSGLLTVCFSMLTGKYIYTFMLETNPLIILASAGIYAFFRGPGREVKKEVSNPRMAKTILWLGSNTFGIYLIHFAVRDILAQCFHLDVATYPAILSVPLNTILIFFISLALTVVFKLIPGLKKIVS